MLTQSQLDLEASILETALKRNGWSVRQAARWAGWTRGKIRRAIERHAKIAAQLAKSGRGPGRPPGPQRGARA